MRKQGQKKKLAFVLTTFVVGGVEKAFLDMLSCLDQSKYDITVFLPDNKGAWTNLLTQQCKVEYLRIEDYKTVLSTQLKHFQIYSAIRSLFFRILARLNYTKNYRKSTEYFIRSMPRVKEHFDCVVCYQIINDDCMLGSLYRIKAPKKLVWTHLDMKKTEPIYEYWYAKFDKIICVSKFSRDSFVRNFPKLEKKAEIIHNVLFPDRIIKMAEDDITLRCSKGETVLVTVARLAAVKGQMVIPRTVRLLLDRGYNIRWYLVGDGEMRDALEKEIDKECVAERVILLGNRDNPYPYIRACDIYVQTSYVEGWGLTVTEAKILGKPIVTTDAGVMSEQIENNINGIIVPDVSAEDIAEQISRLIDSPELRSTFIRQLQYENSCSLTELDKLYAFIEQA